MFCIHIYYLFTFIKYSGQDIIIEKPIPKRNPSSALVHKQAAIKFGKVHDFDMPIYRELVKKLDIDTHVYVSNSFIKFFSDSFPILFFDLIYILQYLYIPNFTLGVYATM